MGWEMENGVYWVESGDFFIKLHILGMTYDERDGWSSFIYLRLLSYTSTAPWYRTAWLYFRTFISTSDSCPSINQSSMFPHAP
jgi:hypothetical protein